MFAEVGLWASVILIVLGICLAFLASGAGLKTAGAVLALLGGLTLALQFWIYYRRWHND
jgi:drug/metabolite transporter (DMT)-like permease